MLDVTRLALADFVVLETDAHTAYDQLDAEVKEEIRERPRQDFHEAQADSKLKELKTKNGSLLNLPASQFMLTLSFSLLRRGLSPNPAVQEIHDLLGISRNKAVK